MHLLRSRPTEAPPEASTPRYRAAVHVPGRTDLCCTACERVIAYGVSADRLDDDAPFFVQAHRPFCVGSAPVA